MTANARTRNTGTTRLVMGSSARCGHWDSTLVMNFNELGPEWAVTSQQPALGKVIVVAMYPAVASFAMCACSGGDSPSSLLPVMERSESAGFIHMVFTATPATKR